MTAALTAALLVSLLESESAGSEAAAAALLLTTGQSWTAAGHGVREAELTGVTSGGSGRHQRR